MAYVIGATTIIVAAQIDFGNPGTLVTADRAIINIAHYVFMSNENDGCPMMQWLIMYFVSLITYWHTD